MSGKQKKWMGSLKIACITPKGKDPVFATNVAWLIGQGYIPELEDHRYYQGEPALVKERRLLSRYSPLGGIRPDWLRSKAYLLYDARR